MYTQVTKDSSPTSLNKKPFLPPYLVIIIVCSLLILATIIINLKMIRDGLNGMTDMKLHIIWLQHFSKQFGEGILYPRWLAGTNYGYGSPTFVFYPPLVYYLGSLIKFSGVSIENNLIILYSLSLFLAGFNFYLFGHNRWGVIAAFVGALAYMTAPYLAFNLYWVSSLSVAFAIAWIPLGWWLTDKSLVQAKWRIGVAIFWMILALTHLPSLLLCGIIWLFYTLFFLLTRPWKNVVATIFFAGVGLGAASFFLLPAILEQHLVDIASMKQIIGDISNAMFGAGLPLFPPRPVMNVDYIFVHQSIVSITLAIIAFVFCRRDRATIKGCRYWLVFVFVLAYLMTYWSLPIWQISTTLQKVQAPWRFLHLFSFGGAALCAVVVSGILKLRLRLRFLLLLLVFCLLLVNLHYSYQLSRKFIALGNPGRGNLDHLQLVRQALDDPYTDKLLDVGEYRPLLANGESSPHPILGKSKFDVVKGNAVIKLIQWESYQRILQVNVVEESNIQIRTYHYPAWHLYVNNKPYLTDISNDGTILFSLQPGSYTVELIYQNTLAFTLGIITSLFSLFILFFSWFGIFRKSSLR